MFKEGDLGLAVSLSKYDMYNGKVGRIVRDSSGDYIAWAPFVVLNNDPRIERNGVTKESLEAMPIPGVREHKIKKL